MRRMKTLVAAGKTNEARVCQRGYLTSMAAKIVAVVEACDDLRRKHRFAPDGSQIISVAKQVDPFHDPGEKVTISRKDKGQGSYRIIHEFEIINRARQKLVLNALRPFRSIDPRQFMTGNGGRDAAIQRVLDLLPRYEWMTELDIRDFYPSIDRGCVPQLMPIAGRVTSSTILLEEAEKTPRTRKNIRDNRHNHHDMDGRCMSEDSQRGLPQGASTSPIVGDMVIAEIMRELPPELPVVNYGDNFLILGRTREDVEEAWKLLEAAVMRRHAGPLELAVKQPATRCADGFDFLGYRFNKIGGNQVVLPNEKNMLKLLWLVARQLRRYKHGLDDADQTKAKLRPAIKSWMAAFALCPTIDFEVFSEVRDLFMEVPNGEALRREVVPLRSLPAGLEQRMALILALHVPASFLHCCRTFPPWRNAP